MIAEIGWTSYPLVYLVLLALAGVCGYIVGLRDGRAFERWRLRRSHKRRMVYHRDCATLTPTRHA